MTHLTRKMTVCCGLAGVLALSAAAPSLAQVVVDPYYGGAYGYAGPYGNAGPYGYVSPYEGYAYVPGYRGRRAWGYPLRYDNTVSARTLAGGPVRPAVLPPIRAGKGSDSKSSASVGS